MLKQPFMNMMQPNKEDYKAKTVEIAIYSYYEHYRHEDYEPDEEEEDDNHRSDFPVNSDDNWYSGYRHQPKLPKIKLDKINLQTLLDLTPEGVNPSDIKMRFTIDSGDMGIYGHEISFYYKKKVAADPEAYKRDYATWKKLHDEWEVKQAAYESEQQQLEIAAKQKEIRDLKERLAKLKK